MSNIKHQKMEDKKLTEKESLQIITEMIARTKERYLGDGNILMMWGYLTVIVAVLVWIMLATTHNDAWNWLWFAIPLVGGIITPILARRQHKVTGAITHYDRISARLWTIFGVSEMVLSAICLAFALFGGINCWIAMLVFTIILAPGTEISQGLFIKEKSLVIGGIIGLVIGMVTLSCVAGRIPLRADWYMPLFIAAFIAMMIVPGHIINYKAKLQ